jgi:AcrR family transcriptional regulator
MASQYPGRGDPQATLSLLWGLPRSTRPGRKPSLTPADIGAAAMGLADAMGLGALSMRALGERLGVSAMSLYRYVPGKPELLDLIVELAYAELPQHGPHGTWQARLAQVACDSWKLYLKHPWMLEISTYRASLGPYSLQKYERELSAVADAGLDDLEMDLVVAAVSDYVRGAARSLVEARSAAQVTGQSNAQWWEVHSGLLAQLVDPNVFPLAVRIGEKAGAQYGGTTDPVRSFEFGLHSLIRGIETRPERAAREKPQGGR